MRSTSMALVGVLLRARQQAARLEYGLTGRGYTDALRSLHAARHASGRFVLGSVVVLAGLVAATLGLQQVAGWSA